MRPQSRSSATCSHQVSISNFADCFAIVDEPLSRPGLPTLSYLGSLPDHPSQESTFVKLPQFLMRLLQQSLPSLSGSQFRRFPSLYPLHTVQSRRFSQTKLQMLRSHKSFRYIEGQGTHRRIQSSDPDNIPATSYRTWPEARQRRLRKCEDVANSWTHTYRHVGYMDFLARDITRRRTAHHKRVHVRRNLNLPTKAPPASSKGESDSSPANNDGIPTLNHLTSTGEAHMVSIASKVPTSRSATATTILLFSQALTYSALLASRLRKGDAISVARIAGIQAAKKTSDLIPLAHPGLNITGVSVMLEPFPGTQLPYPLVSQSLGINKANKKVCGGVFVTATVECEGKTGVEMEAMTAASVAGLTMYDMLKGVDKAMVLTSTRVVAKSGGKSGDWRWDYTLNKIIKDDGSLKEKEQDLQKTNENFKTERIKTTVRRKQREVLRTDGIGRVDADDFETRRARRLNRILELRARLWPTT